MKLWEWVRSPSRWDTNDGTQKLPSLGWQEQVSMGEKIAEAAVRWRTRRNSAVGAGREMRCKQKRKKLS